jgi:hypothetical protein
VEALSLSAEFLLLSIDPGDGGLIGDKKRVLRAVRAAGGTPDSALAELKEEGLVRGGLGRLGARVELVDRTPPGRRYRAIEQAIRDDTLGDERDKELFVLLSWSGVMARRLPKHERRTAASRLRHVARTSPLAGVIAGSDSGDLLEESELIGAGLATEFGQHADQPANTFGAGQMP